MKSALLFGFCSAMFLVLACGGTSPDSTPLKPSAGTTPMAPTPKSEFQPTLPSAQIGSSTTEPTPGSEFLTSPSPTPLAIPSLALKVAGVSRSEGLLSEDDVVEVTVETPGFALVGFTSPVAVLSVNGKLVPVDDEGMFVDYMTLQEGPNFAELVVSDLFGNQRSTLLVVHFIPQDQGVPLHMIWPPDEFNVDVGRISIIGTTRSDAVVSVNGTAITVNGESGFHQEVILQEGPNLVEITASDFLGNSQTVQRIVTWTNES